MSTACALGVFGTQLGAAAGFLLPSTFVRDHEDVQLIGNDLSRLTYGTAILASMSALGVVLCKIYIMFIRKL